MVEQQGMFGITPELEEQGRGGDTEVGFVEVDSVVVPNPLSQNKDLKDTFDSIKNAIEMQGQNPKQFTVTADNELYAYSKDNAIPAHLTNGEFVIPIQVINTDPDMKDNLGRLFLAGGLDINEYIVGNPKNKINPQTGYPEFWFWVAAAVVVASTPQGQEAIKDVGKAVKRGVDGVVDFGSNFVKSLGQGVEDLFDGDIDAVLKNPAVIATASAMFPGYGAYINLGAKAVTGQEIKTSDLVSAGFSATTDFTNIDIDPNAVKAVTTAAQVSEGTDPVQALANNYGADWLNESGIGDNIKTGVRSTIGQEYSDRVFNTIDVNQAVADYASGKSTERILANQFGDELVGALNSTNPSVNAAGYAGLESAVLKAEGLSDQDALLGGAQTYYDRGGQLPDLNAVGSLAGIDLPKVNFGDTGFIKDLYAGTLGKLPELPDLPDVGFIEDYLKQYSPNISGKLDWKGINPDLSFFDIAKSDIDLGKLDINVDVGDFDFASLNTPEIPDFDINMPDLPDINLPSFDLPFNAPRPEMPSLTGGSLDIARAEQEAEREADDALKIDELLLADFSLKNPLRNA